VTARLTGDLLFVQYVVGRVVSSYTAMRSISQSTVLWLTELKGTFVP